MIGLPEVALRKVEVNEIWAQKYIFLIKNPSHNLFPHKNLTQTFLHC